MCIKKSDFIYVKYTMEVLNKYKDSLGKDNLNHFVNLLIKNSNIIDKNGNTTYLQDAMRSLNEYKEILGENYLDNIVNPLTKYFNDISINKKQTYLYNAIELLKKYKEILGEDSLNILMEKLINYKIIDNNREINTNYELYVFKLFNRYKQEFEKRTLNKFLTLIESQLTLQFLLDFVTF
jgi:hypothetical protein